MGSYEVFLVQLKSGRHWGFPKGHFEKNENPKTCAERELFEETHLVIEQYLSKNTFEENYHLIRQDKKIEKTVTYFLALVKGEIFLQINSNGGSFPGARFLHENILISANPVIGVVSGKCFSAATFVLQACTKRYATKLSRIQAHFVSNPISFTIKIDDEMDQLIKKVQWERNLLHKNNEILINALSQKINDKEAMMELLKQEKVITASEAKKVGFIDDIV